MCRRAAGLLGALAEGVSKSMSGGSSKAAQEPISLLIAEWNRVRLSPSLNPSSPSPCQLQCILTILTMISLPTQNFWNRRNIDVSLVLKPAPSDPYAHPYAYGGRGVGRRDDRRSRKQAKRAERSAFGTELIADVHHMLGAKESSAAYRAAADQERYAGQPGWCLVLQYKGPSYAAGGSGRATRP